METGDALSALLLSHIEDTEYYLRGLRQSYIGRKKRSEMRDDCECVKAYLRKQETRSKLAKEEEEKMIREIEAAISKASLVHSETIKPKTTKLQNPKNREATLNPAALVNQQMGNYPMPPKSASTCKPKQMKNSGRRFKPAHETAPYRTETVKTRRQASNTVRHSQLPEKNTVENSEIKLAKQDETGDPNGNNESITRSALQTVIPDYEKKLLVGPDFRCTCIQREKAENIKLIESLELRIWSLWSKYDFQPVESAADRFVQLLHSKNQHYGNYEKIAQSLLSDYQRVVLLVEQFFNILRMFNFHFIEATQEQWIHHMFQRLVVLRQLLQLAHSQLIELSPLVTNPKTEDLGDDPISSWLATVCARKQWDSCFSETNNPMFTPYFSAGPPPQAMPSRLFGFTMASNLITLEGTREQLQEYMNLWEAVESANFKSRLLSILRLELPRLLQSLTTSPKRASAFRELYGLMCSSYPVALKEFVHA